MSRPQAQMDLLYTKLHPPPLRERRVARLSLLQKLDVAVNQKLTLICAPAGYGKTTLLSQWINDRNDPICWYSLDRSDNDLAQFLRYFLAAIQGIDPDVGPPISEKLQPPQPSSNPAIWAALINQVAASEKAFVIILDDYQVVESRAVHEALNYLIEHMPANMHLILATRADPPFPLPRLRARGYLTELRQADLRFTAEEAADFLNNVWGLDLSAKDVTALETHTEGWVAALQMAALSLQKHGPDPAIRSEFIRAFTGSHRFILDYLVEEVLEQQSPALQAFLLKTSILERMSGSLCDAILTEPEPGDKVQTPRFPVANAQSILEQLEATNLFIIPLDEERRWYRYHRLFSDLLYKRLWQTSPDLVPILHQRASAWHEQQGRLDAAIDHALAAFNFERAATLIDTCAEATLMRSEVMTFLNWVKQLPDEKVRRRPTLCFYHAWALLMSGRSLDVVEQRLQDVAFVQDTPERTGIIAGRMATLRAYLMLFRPDIQRAAELCH